MKHARFYSYYRVVHGVLSSTSFILTVFLIKIVSPIVDLKLYEGIVTKFRALFEISPTTKPEIMKWLFLSVTTFLVFYSLAMIVTALSRYVYHSKGQNMTIKGQISLGIYFFFHVVTWCTVWLALFSTAGLGTNSVCYMQGKSKTVIVEDTVLFCSLQQFSHLDPWRAFFLIRCPSRALILNLCAAEKVHCQMCCVWPL